jgi:hypothetical protein
MVMKVHFEEAGLWVVFGFLLGVAFLGLAALLPLLDHYDDFLNYYQTLLGSILALGGALLTVWIISAQIKQSHEVDERRRLVSLRAARAMLPFALTQITEYASESIEKIIGLLPDDDEENGTIKIPPTAILAPALPKEALPILRECIESAEAEPARRMAELVETLQVQNSRFHGLLDKLAGKGMYGLATSAADAYDVRRRIIDSLELYAMTDQIYDYARNRSDHVDPKLNLSLVLNAAINCNVDDDYVTVRKLLERDYSD